MKMRELATAFVAIVMILALAQPSHSQTPFYEGKTITIIQARGAGGTGDMRVRALMPFLRKYIPGQPTIVNEYMPGAGGRKAANYIYGTVRPDGLTIGNIGGGLLANAFLEARGVQYDFEKLIYIGATNSSSHDVFFTHQAAKLDSLEKLRAAKGVRVGVQTVGDHIYIKSRLFAYLLGMKDPRFIAGYRGAQRYVALERGEVDALTVTADPVLRDIPDWIEKRMVHFHAIIEVPRGEKHSYFGHLPELESFAGSGTERRLLALDRGIRRFGSPYILPPGTPSERVQILQEAMRRTFADKEFHKEFTKLTAEDPAPLTPEAMEESLKQLPRDPEIISLLRKIAGTDPLPAR